MHSKASDTNAKKAHCETHKKALSIKKTNPEMFPPDENATDFEGENANKVTAPNQPSATPIAPSRSPGPAMA